MERIAEPVYIIEDNGQTALGQGGNASFGDRMDADSVPLLGYAPPVKLRDLGDATFCDDHGLEYPCVAGAMANGIGSVEIVEAMARNGMVGFFGAAGLSPARVEAAVDRLSANLDGLPFGFNLIHSPHEQDLEAAVVDLYLRKGVRLVSASAYLRLTPHVVRYRVSGIHRDPQGRIIVPNRVLAKVSRVEVARQFFAPPPDKILRELVSAGQITAEEATLAQRIPVAQDLTAEADSGGHTDNRPAISLLPTMLALRDQMQDEFCYDQPLRVGAAGGVATPTAAAAAFAMGAAYLVTGSVNQSCQESGTCDEVRKMLAEAKQADVTMAPAADMFEMGVKVQVLKRGTMFAMRAAKLFELYRSCDSLESIPDSDRAFLEKNLFRDRLGEIWRQTREFFQTRDPRQNEKAEKDPKHKMALVFRWYLGQSSRWANSGEPTRKVDYQVWCGPAMGAFNEWVKGSFLEAPHNRRVAEVGMNLLFGAAVLTRVNVLRIQGVKLSPEATSVRPQAIEHIHEMIDSRGLRV